MSLPCPPILPHRFAEAELPSFVKAQRPRYELGLLKWLRAQPTTAC